MLRKIPCSQETTFQAQHSPMKLVKVVSMFPVDRGDCACAPLIIQWKKKLAMANQKDRNQLIADNPVIHCPRDKSHMQQYQVFCGNCNQPQGTLWATDATLRDWCDFHYTQWTKGDFWHGCFTPHVSPITEEICFECCCGQDTRDFRANMTMPQRQAERIEAKNSIGRQFGQPNSKFYVKLIA